MRQAHERHWSDTAAELAGAAALAAGCGGAAALAAPALGWIAAIAGGAAGWAAMRAVPAERQTMPLAPFEPAAIEFSEAPPPVAEPRPLRLVREGDASAAAAAAVIPPDATDALHAALDDIRRLIRRG